MALRVALVAGLLAVGESQASDATDRTNPQGFLPRSVGFDASKSLLKASLGYDKFIGANIHHKKTEALSHHNPAGHEPATDMQEEKSVQKLLDNGYNSPITLSAIGVGLVSLLAMLGARIRRGWQTTSVLASSSTPESDMSINMARGASEKFMEIEEQGSDMKSAGALERRDFVVGTAATMLGPMALAGNPTPAFADLKAKVWTQVSLPVTTTLFDIAFDTPEHGYLVGSKGTFLETIDAGKTWKPRTFANLDEEEEVGYRFEKISFKNGEGWVIGKPSVLLHTTDSGKSWERIPLSPKLPGEPSGIYALGNSKAEMTTTTGAIYSTTNAGRNWKAEVKESIDATLNRVSSSGVSGASYYSGNVGNIKRASDGSYLSVASRGNFYLTWKPGDDFWLPHNRGTSRRITAMGYVGDDASKGVWMTLNGGQMSLAGKAATEDVEPDFENVKIDSGGYGILDCDYRTPTESWAVGGGGTMYVSKDGGKTYKFDGSADKIPGNLYAVKFFNENTGYALGSDGVLMRYLG